MRVAVLLLCHESPQGVAQALASPFFRDPDIKVYLHHDAAQGEASFAAMRRALPADVACEVLTDRVRVGWGEHSIVEATRRLMVAALADGAFGATHLFLASGSCEPIRPASSLKRFLAERPGIEFIQAHDISLGRWIVDGLEEERFRFYFPFNFATQRRAFEAATRWQRRLGVRREVPAGLQIHFGSQWFCLTRETCRAVSEQLARPELDRFFRHSWIPDEFAIQTLVAQACPPERIARHNLTYYEFDRGGRPLVLENDHAEHLRRQPFFFARKLAPEAHALRARLHATCAQPEDDLSWFQHAGTATADFHRFLARAEIDPSQRAHVGTSLEADGGPMAANRRRYYVLHASARGYLLALLQRAREVGGRLPVFDYPFDRNGLRLAAERQEWYGFRPEDRYRAAYDPLGFLRELVHADPEHPTAFAIDPAAGGLPVEFLGRDPRAILVDCDPPQAGRLSRAAAAVQHVGGRHEAWVLDGTMKALRKGRPLPQDRWREPADRFKAGAEHITLRELPLRAHLDPTAAALARAAQDVAAQGWYPSEAAGEFLTTGAIATRRYGKQGRSGGRKPGTRIA